MMTWLQPVRQAMDEIETLVHLVLALLVIIAAGVIVFWLATRP